MAWRFLAALRAARNDKMQVVFGYYAGLAGQATGGVRKGLKRKPQANDGSRPATGALVVLQIP